MRQNSVNNHQSHPKFRFSTRLIQKKSVWVWQKTILFNFFLCTPLRRTPFHSSLCSSIFTSKVFGLTLQCINNQMASLETQSGQEKQSNDCSIKILMVHRRSFVTWLFLWSQRRKPYDQLPPRCAQGQGGFAHHQAQVSFNFLLRII